MQQLSSVEKTAAAPFSVSMGHTMVSFHTGGSCGITRGTTTDSVPPLVTERSNWEREREDRVLIRELGCESGTPVSFKRICCLRFSNSCRREMGSVKTNDGTNVLTRRERACAAIQKVYLLGYVP